ncbi:SLAIN motif-containing protein 2-like [Centruroides sculpturatus]|uniref:SLAIN motif-containing protein 2-like n=1 Tax=Centruroides sculpturatus TaxID=218467 RepID=UPI000C6DA184|nr:SLAIN motif-containing protein 2-like [Centruroides sculpturatus]
MNVIMEDRKRSAVDPKEEVKKLQDLVKKLELQNQQLRNRQNRNTIVPKDSNINMARMMTGKKTIHEPNRYGILTNKNSQTSPNKCEKRKSSTLEEVTLIDIDDMELSEDESWLYTSPKSLPPEEETLSPYIWLRRDVEDPCNKELQLAKKALLNKLDELAVLTPGQDQSKKQSISRIQKPREIPIRRQSIGQPRVFDSRTFTRSRKKRNSIELPVIEPLDFTDAAEKDISTEKSNSSTLEKDLSMSKILNLTDVSEVQEIARMQEESLKQDFSISKRHSDSFSGRKFSVSSRSSISDIENQEITTKLYSEESLLSTKTSRIPTDQSSASDYSSPPDSPYSSSMSLNTGSNTDSGQTISSQPLAYNGVKHLRNQQFNSPKLIQYNISKSSSNIQRFDSKIIPPSQKYREKSYSAPSSRIKSTIPAPAINSGSTQNLDHITTHNLSSGFSSETIQQSSHTGLRKPTVYRPSKTISKPRSGIPIKSRQSMRNAMDDDWSEGCF